MSDVVIVSGCRTAIGEFGGTLRDVHAAKISSVPMKAAIDRAGISPKMAQILARHSDIRLTLGVYTHVEVHARTAAIRSLPAPPNGENGTVAS